MFQNSLQHLGFHNVVSSYVKRIVLGTTQFSQWQKVGGGSDFNRRYVRYLTNYLRDLYDDS